MEALKRLGINESDVKKVSAIMADSIDELNSLKSYIDDPDVAPNLRETYNSLEKQIESYLYSDEFKKEAEKSGVKLRSSILADEEVKIEKIEKKTKTFAERMAERKAKKEAKSETKETENEEVESAIIEEPEVESIQKVDEEEVSEKLFGYFVTGETGGEIVGRDHLSTLLAYGKTDYKLGFYEDTTGFHYRLDLPASMGQIIFSLRPASNAGDLSSIIDVWKEYINDKFAKISLVSRSKDQLDQLSAVLGYSTVVKERTPIGNADLLDNRYNASFYDEVSEIYSRSLDNNIYFNNLRDIKVGWETETPLSSGSTIVYGLDFGDYVYRTAEDFYLKGGSSIVVKNATMYVPKGLGIDYVFAEAGSHLKSAGIKTSKFEKDIATGKRFQIGTGSYDKALDCRIIGVSLDSNNWMRVADASGQFWKISREAYNYFKKYYGANIYLKLSKETVLVYGEEGVVGLISAHKYSSLTIEGMVDYGAVRNSLRSINSNAFDFMVYKTSVEEVQDSEEIEVIEDEIEDADTEDLKALKEELDLRIEFIQELYDDAVLEGDSQPLIDELELELDALKEMLSELE